MKKLAKVTANVANAELYSCEMCKHPYRKNYIVDNKFNYILSDEEIRKLAESAIGCNVYYKYNGRHFHIKVEDTHKIYAYDIVTWNNCGYNSLVKSWSY